MDSLNGDVQMRADGARDEVPTEFDPADIASKSAPEAQM